MHIVDGALSLPVLATGGAIALGSTALGLKKIDLDHIPQVGLLSAAFFLASLIHVPIGPSSVHLILNGLVGLVLGWTAFPAMLVGLLLQAVFFGFGGLVVLGVNLVNIALPAVMVHHLLKWPLPHAKSNNQMFVWGFLAGSLAIVFTTGLVALSLFFSGEEFLAAAQLVFYAHVPVMILEGFLTGAAVVLISRVKPEMLQLSTQLRQEETSPVSQSPPSKQAILSLLFIVCLWTVDAQAHNILFDLYLEGDKIEGEVGFSNGDSGVNVPVTVTDNAGNILGTATTDTDGVFIFSITKKIDHHFEANAGAGHIAKKIVKAEELDGSSTSVGSTSVPMTNAENIGVTASQIQEMVEQAVARQVKPLRKQLLQYENTVRIHDILGGLGYILGLTCLGLWFSERRKRKAE